MTASCAHCGTRVTIYGPEVYHTETTLIRCDNREGTRATALLVGNRDHTNQEEE